MDDLFSLEPDEISSRSIEYLELPLEVQVDWALNFITIGNLARRVLIRHRTPIKNFKLALRALAPLGLSPAGIPNLRSVFLMDKTPRFSQPLSSLQLPDNLVVKIEGIESSPTGETIASLEEATYLKGALASVFGPAELRLISQRYCQIGTYLEPYTEEPSPDWIPPFELRALSHEQRRELKIEVLGLGHRINRALKKNLSPYTQAFAQPVFTIGQLVDLQLNELQFKFAAQNKSEIRPDDPLYVVQSLARIDEALKKPSPR